MSGRHRRKHHGDQFIRHHALITISAGATNVSVAGGTYNGNGANIYGIVAPSSASRVNIDKVTVQNCGQDCIQLNGNGSGTFDNEMTVTRCDVSGSPGHSGISIWNATQTTCVDNYCHNNSVGIWMGNCGYCNIANNTCVSNSTGINCNSGSDNYVVNNTCDNNGTGILRRRVRQHDCFGFAGAATRWRESIPAAAATSTWTICSRRATPTNFISGRFRVTTLWPTKVRLSAPGQNYFYPPLINDQHNTTIVNGMGRTDLTISSTPIDNVQSEYNAAISANPGNVIVLHLNGTFTRRLECR